MATITFQVNLDTVDKFTSKQPYNQYDSTIADNFKSTRVTWFPDFIRNNRELKNGSQFTVEGSAAKYLKDNFTTGEFKFLDVITETVP